MTYFEAIHALKAAAQTALAAARDKAAPPEIDVNSLALLADEADRLADYDHISGRYPSLIQKARSER